MDDMTDSTSKLRSMGIHRMPSQIIDASQSQAMQENLSNNKSPEGYAHFWQQLASTISQIQANPSAIELRFLQVEALIGLGLSTLSNRECDRLAQTTDQLPRIDRYRALISELKDDRISIEERESNLRNNLARINDQVHFDDERIEQWRSIANEISWYRALDGNIVRCDEQRGRIAHLTDVRSAHHHAMSPLIEQMKTKRLPPVLVEGVDPHWILSSLLNAAPPSDSPNFQQRVLVVQADWNELFDGFSCTNLGEQLGSSRFLWFVGEDAPTRLLAWYEDRIDDVPPAMVIQNPLIRTRSNPDSRALLKLIDSKWESNSASLINRTQNRVPKDQSALKAKFDYLIARTQNDVKNKRDSDSDPLRILIPTSRYTTYLQYVSSDLAQVFTQLGCECLVQIEDDDSQVYSKNNHLQLINEFDPDLVISINTPRIIISEHSPTDIPHVCWIQDAMDHLFDIKVGQSIGANDFIVGQVKDDFVEKFAYPRSQTKWMPMVASGSKFTQGITNDLNPKAFDCEIAWVTHQSEHPDLLKAKLLQSIQGQSPNVVHDLGLVLDEVARLIASVPHTRFFTEIQQTLDRVFFPSGASPENNSTRSLLLNTHVIPYAERVFRHQTAIWASKIADRRGWRLKLFGNGWENHPQLSRYAAGPVGHGDELAQCYQGAVVHLHASVNQVMHQRVTECLLSGGLPLCRPLRDAFAVLNNMAIAETIEMNVGEPRADDSGAQDGIFVRSDQCPTAQRYIEEMHRLGLCEKHEFLDGKLGWPDFKVHAATRSLQSPIEYANAQAFAYSTDLFFTSETQLEALLEQAIDDPHWRADRIKNGIASMPKEMTMDGFVENLISFIHAGLCKS